MFSNSNALINTDNLVAPSSPVPLNSTVPAAAAAKS